MRAPVPQQTVERANRPYRLEQIDDAAVVIIALELADLGPQWEGRKEEARERE